MADDENGRHRVTTRLRRIDDGETTVYESGDELVPTDVELASFGDLLDPVDDADETETDESDADAAENDDDEDEDAETDDDGAVERPDDSVVFAEAVREAEYPELRRIAKRYDDIDGRSSESDLRDALLAKADE